MKSTMRISLRPWPILSLVELNTDDAPSLGINAHVPESRSLHGTFTQGTSGVTSDVVNPAKDAILSQLPHAKQSELDAALAAADKGFKIWKRVSAYERGKILRKAADLLRAEVIARLLTKEQDKILAEARVEVLGAADIIDWFAEEGRRAYGPYHPSAC
jgi:succinate-semialdehyde dehydrogenase / glutarate-semialdehyde dehydrogenase